MADLTQNYVPMFDNLDQAVLQQQIKLATRKAIYFTGPSGGGTVKTGTTNLLASIARLAGFSPLLIDADIGLLGLSHQIGKGNTGQFPEAFDPSYASRLAGVASRHSHVFVDVGANCFLLPSVCENLLSIMQRFVRDGWACVILLCLIPNKDGLKGDAKKFVEMFGEIDDLEVSLVLTDQDGSSNFKPYKELTDQYPSIRVPRVDGGLRELVSGCGGPMSTLIERPPSGYARAAAWLASVLDEVAAQPATVDLLGCAPDRARLEALAERKPNRRYLARDRLEQVSDAALTADEAFLRIEAALRQLPASTNDSWLLRHARPYLNAWHHRRKTQERG